MEYTRQLCDSIRPRPASVVASVETEKSLAPDRSFAHTDKRATCNKKNLVRLGMPG
jgi:hypothetical protein